MKGRLDRLLRPESLAFIGGTAAELAIDACRSLGFSGEMWAVNPRRGLRGVPTFASVGELPAAVDAAFVGVNRHACVQAVRELAEAGAGVAVCHASGFAEAGESGAALQAELVAAAAGMALLGPNCYGTLSAVTGAALWPDVHGLSRCQQGVAMISQSGNMAVNLTMQRRGLDVAHVMALGNQADVGTAEALEALVDDESVTAAGLILEAVDDVERFATAVHKAQRRRLPVVALKLGSSAAAGAIAVTHTASMVGSDAAYDALFRRIGVRRVRTVPDLLDTLAVLGAVGPLPGRRLASLSCSGGEAGLVADSSRRLSLDFPDFAPDHARQVADALNDTRASVTNPLDYHTLIWGNETRLKECFGAVLGPGSEFAAAENLTSPPGAVAGPEVLGAGAVIGAGGGLSLPGAVAGPEVLGAGAAADSGGGLPKVPAPVVGAREAVSRPFDAAVLVLDFPAAGVDRSRWWPTLDAFGATCKATGTRGVVAASMSENMPQEARTRAARLGLAACADIDTALSALEAAADWGRHLAATAHRPPARLLAARRQSSTASGASNSKSVSRMSAEAAQISPAAADRGRTAGAAGHHVWWPAQISPGAADRGREPPPSPAAGSGRNSAARVLPEHDAKLLLAGAGIAVPAGVTVAADEAVAAAERIGHPVVLKATGAAHKSDIGGVVVGLADAAGVAAAARRLHKAGFEELLVEACVGGAVAELLVSVRSSPPVGMLLTLGAGGTLVEHLDDTAVLLLPAEPDEILAALQSLRVWPLLTGSRGRPAASVEAVVEAAAALSSLVHDDPSITDIEINPLLATPESAVAADALIVTSAIPTPYNPEGGSP